MKHNTLSHNLKLARPGAKELSLALVLLMLATVGSAQTPKPSPQAGQILSERPDSSPSGATNPSPLVISGQYGWTSVWWVSDPGRQPIWHCPPFICRCTPQTPQYCPKSDPTPNTISEYLEPSDDSTQRVGKQRLQLTAAIRKGQGTPELIKVAPPTLLR
jgi:hypothetical protein